MESKVPSNSLIMKPLKRDGKELSKNKKKIQQFKIKVKTGSCFECNSTGHKLAQCPIRAILKMLKSPSSDSCIKNTTKVPLSHEFDNFQINKNDLNKETSIQNSTLVPQSVSYPKAQFRNLELLLNSWSQCIEMFQNLPYF